MDKIIETTIYSGDLREDQWDLIVQALTHVRKATTGADSHYGIDTLCRKFLRRRVDEALKDIAAQVPCSE